MIVMPAIDLRGGACVQLVGGSYAEERVRLPDPLAVARRWREHGFEHLHVVDLDAATGTGSNDDVVAQVLSLDATTCEVGGGVRDDKRVDALMSQGAARVLASTRALEEPGWLAAQASRWPNRLVLALEVKQGRLATHGWSRAASVELDDALRATATLPLAGVFVTSVDYEGRMAGCDLALIDSVRALTPHPIIASGGITSFADLRALAEREVWGAVIGMALYTGTIDAERVAREFGR